MIATNSTTSHSGTRHADDHRPSALTRAAGVIVAVTALLAVLAIAFALPATRSAPMTCLSVLRGPRLRARESRTPSSRKCPARSR